MSGALQAIIVPVTGFQQNCTLLFDGESKAAVVVDPGGDIDRIMEAADGHGLTIGAIWLTHGHIDHAGGAMDLKDRLGVEIIGPHRNDEPLLGALEQQAAMFGVDAAVRNVVPNRWLAEGDTLDLDGHTFEVLHCPGHAPGHVVFVNRAAQFAHVGEVLFRGSVGRTDLPGGNHETLIASIRDKLMPLGDDFGFICGHGPGGRLGEERRTNPFLAGQV
ncbi:MAG: MBL fold metallo-hydrolase [Roseitalea sp.]|nr:MBL fold metallo-hydrolase [Roseitalea sp.]